MGFLSSPNRPNASNTPAVFQRSSTCHAPKGAAARCCSVRLLAGPGGAALCRRSVFVGDSPMSLFKLEPISLKNSDTLNEKWVQQQLAEEPSLLGLGDL